MVDWTGIEETYSSHVSIHATQPSPTMVRRRAQIILNDKRDAYLDEALGAVLAYWEGRFARDGL
jgi:hypothetical protein